MPDHLNSLADFKLSVREVLTLLMSIVIGYAFISLGIAWLSFAGGVATGCWLWIELHGAVSRRHSDHARRPAEPPPAP